MKRFVASCLLMISIVTLSGVMPATSAPPRCQVVATGTYKSCSIFLPNGGKVSAILVGVGVITVVGPTTYGAWGCPQKALGCIGLVFVVEAGTRVTVSVLAGVGRLSHGLP